MLNLFRIKFEIHFQVVNLNSKIELALPNDLKP
jgi:hypothetical protein